MNGSVDIKIAEELSALCPGAALMVITYRARVEKSSPDLVALMDEAIGGLRSRHTMADIAEIPHIRDTRAAYRSLGKAPTAYRGAAEAMLRRIVKGSGLYHINNVVDVQNLISVTTGYPVGSYDLGCLTGPVEWRRAAPGESYQGIGKDVLNVEYLPTLYDRAGAFGNPTSDSRRAMISPGEHAIASVLYSFSGTDGFDGIAPRYQALLAEHCGVGESAVSIIA